MFKKKVVVFIVVATMLLLSIAGYASSHTEKIEAYLSHGMNFMVDGESWQPQETDGSKLIPIVYKGRTYVPARALLEARGVKVGYVDATRTVVLDYPAKELDKSTPVLFERRHSNGIHTLEIKTNDNMEAPLLEGKSETEIELEEGAKILLDGEEVNIEELLNSDNRINMDYGKIIVQYDPVTGKASSVSMMNASAPVIFASRVDIEIEIKYPPFKIKITIRW